MLIHLLGSASVQPEKVAGRVSGSRGKALGSSGRQCAGYRRRSDPRVDGALRQPGVRVPIRTGRGHCRLRVLPRCLRSGAAVGFARFHRGAHSIHAGQGLLTPASSPATRRIATRLSHYEGVVVDGEFWITYHVCLPRDANTCLASSGGSRSERAEGGRRVRVREGDSERLADCWHACPTSPHRHRRS